jgi:hypothetical protein
MIKFIKSIFRPIKRYRTCHILDGHQITILVPGVAESEDEKADYILDAIKLMETHIQIIKTQVK